VKKAWTYKLSYENYLSEKENLENLEKEFANEYSKKHFKNLINRIEATLDEEINDSLSYETALKLCPLKNEIVEDLFNQTFGTNYPFKYVDAAIITLQADENLTAEIKTDYYNDIPN